MKRLAPILISGFLLVGLIAAAAPARGDDKPAKDKPAGNKPAQPQQVVHRITGLFSPDREADLRTALEAIPGVELVSLDFDHAEATFSYDPATAFSGTKPDQIVQRFDQRLREASGHTLGVKPLSTTPRDQLTRVEIRVAPLDCKACCLGAYEILAKQDGVEQATVNMTDGRLTALIDPAKTSRDALVAVLKAREITLRDR